MTEQLFQIGIKAIIRNDENQILLLKIRTIGIFQAVEWIKARI